MKKKILLKLKKIFSSRIFKLVICVLAIAAIVGLRYVKVSEVKFGKQLLEIITDGNTLSVFLAGVVAVFVALIVRLVARNLEESMKTEDDHHKIVCKYEHDRKDIDKSQNLYDPNGVYMYLSNVNNKTVPKNHVKDKYSKEFTKKQEDINEFMGKSAGNENNNSDKKKCRLFIPSLTVFTNIKGDTHINFKDSKDKHELPAFVNENALSLIEAHKMSNVSNNVTIRLNDFSYEGNSLTFNTMRSQYLDMLVTNRCMDYKINDSLSIRDIYEAGNRITPLGKSQLGNQIGINGLIITKNNYLLLEKRGSKKTIWKDKFAQPISLALKKSDFLKNAEVMSDDSESAEKAFKNVILNTLNKNFGLTEDDIEGFKFEKNFFGLARDLLEGGKPNMYFYVVVNKTAREFAAMLEENVREKAKRDNQLINQETPKQNGEKKDLDKKESKLDLSNDKMDSDFYLIKRNDIKIDYDYKLKVRMRDIINVRRKLYPRVSKSAEKLFKLKQSLKRELNKECGEALLASLYYLDACSDRIIVENDIK